MEDAMKATTGVCAMVILAALLACKSKDSTPRAAEMTVSATQLILEYKDNEVAADQRYKGKRLRTNGIVSDIKKDIVDDIYVTLGSGAEFEIPELMAYFPDSLENKAAGLRKGQELTVECDCEGLMINIVMKECTFVGL
jgi:hypothetical protein